MKVLKVFLAVVSMITITHQAHLAKRASTSTPLSIPEAKKRFCESPEELEKVKQDITNHYTKRVNELYTGFENEINDICTQIFEFFNHQTDLKHHSAIIFDIDETVLSNFELSKLLNFESRRGSDDNYSFRVGKKCTAILPMLTLCKKLKDMDFHLIYVSARRGTDDLIKATQENLEREGYHVDELYLMPMEIHNEKDPEKKVHTKTWKENVRKELSEKYDIIACIGDNDDDMTGECCGKKFKLPNYLY